MPGISMGIHLRPFNLLLWAQNYFAIGMRMLRRRLQVECMDERRVRSKDGKIVKGGFILNNILKEREKNRR